MFNRVNINSQEIDFSQISTTQKIGTSSPQPKFSNMNEHSFVSQQGDVPVVDFTTIKFNSMPGNSKKPMSATQSPNPSMKIAPKVATSVLSSINDFSIGRALKSLSDFDFGNPSKNVSVSSSNIGNNNTYINPGLMSLDLTEMQRPRAATSMNLSQSQQLPQSQSQPISQSQQSINTFDFTKSSTMSQIQMPTNQSHIFGDPFRKVQNMTSLDNILATSSYHLEDNFDPSSIKKQLRGAIIVITI